ncbi:MAG TPA: hypothetical protein VFT04_09200 [Gemmatimonadales bacterium]|nr:hypothetical protein [Gemmatimonadales bacterium]
MTSGAAVTVPRTPRAVGLAGFVLLLLASAIARPAAAQRVAGRWAIMLRGGVSGTLRGELRLEERAGSLGGTLWLENQERPVPIEGAADGAQVRFSGALPARTEFRGALDGNVLRGIATDTGAGRPWTASRMRAEAEYYPVLPRFTLRQVIAGRRSSELRVPGAWVAAARGRNWGTDTAYAALARASGMSRLEGRTLEQAAPARAMGTAFRAETRAAVSRTLSAMRAQIPTPALGSRFDRLFRPRGEWLVDLHDAALALARAGAPSLDFAAAGSGLAAIGWLQSDVPPAEAIPLALYRLHALHSADSAAYGLLIEAMRRSSPASADAVTSLLGAYEAAEAWHGAALRFLLAERWIAASSGPQSIADLMQRSWEGRLDSIIVPEIGPRLFHYPQAVPRYGIPGALFPCLVQEENLSARQWMERHTGAGLLEALRLLETDFGASAVLEAPAETLRITSVREQSLHSANGFLEPRDAVLVDPGYVPLLALGAVVHEWEHLLEERRRRLTLANGAGEMIVLPAIDPFIAEGAAERSTELLLAPLVARFPLLGMAEAEKRTRLAATSRNEQHVLGYAMIRALEEAVADPARREVLVEIAGDDPAAAARAPELAAAWRRHARVPDLRLDAPSRRVLVPETTFTVEDRYPDVIATRIVTP